MTKILKIKKQSIALVVFTLVVFGLSACGGARKSVDKSADYKSARSLPPLQKPETRSRVLVEDSQEVVGEGATNTVDSQDAGQPVSSNKVPIADIELARQVIKTSADVLRLRLDTDFELAWSYLSQKLQSSTVTVFTRNKDARRIDIGCGDADDPAQASRSGGWSIFRRDSKNKSDYCALQLNERRGVTIVSLLDRRGDEIVGDYSANVFNQLK